VVKAVDLAEEGDVIVVDAQGVEIAVWGELATLSAMRRGIKGVVIDGGVRDVDDIAKLGFPVWARCVVPNAGEPHGHGELQVSVTCGGQRVSPGDIIVADDVGVVVVPKELASEILAKSREIAEKERRYKAEIRAGKTLSEIFGL
jgi:3-hexulose-6-phosphate synthase/6-phospho-3-hexuloisomerase